MKFQITFKDPDYMMGDIPHAERAKAKKLLEKWLDYDEYVTIEIDTETKTAKVLEN